MTREEFKAIAGKLRVAYKRDGFLGDKRELDLWMRLLGGLNYRMLDKAADDYIMSSQYQPTIADLNRRYKEIEDRIGARKRELSEIYDDTKGRYPEPDEAKDLWESIVKTGRTWNERIDRANQVKNKVWRFIENAERTGRINEVPTFSEYLRKIGDELRS